MGVRKVGVTTMTGCSTGPPNIQQIQLIVAHPGEDLGEIQEVLPVRVRHRADAHNITVVTAVPLHTHGRDRQEGGGVLLLLALSTFLILLSRA